MSKIKVAIVGTGNCASALVQGLQYYSNSTEEVPGLLFQKIAGYTIQDIEVVTAFDVDCRKVGKHLGEALFSKPNCARKFYDLDPKFGPVVLKGEVLDGVSEYMELQPEDRGFRIDPAQQPVDVVQALKDSGAHILINYLPVGSQEATEYYAQCAIDAGVAFLNCIPVFIASNPKWGEKFINAGLPVIGDDMRSQVGASITSQVIQELLFDRGGEVIFHSQVNQGGNTDFNNMTVKERCESKKISKENVIRSQHEIRGIEAPEDSIFAGPAAFIPYLKDNKIAHFDIRALGFGGAPIQIDIKLSVQDSENSAGVVVDAIRYLKVALDNGVVGPLEGPSSWTQKTPPKQLPYSQAKDLCKNYANGLNNES